MMVRPKLYALLLLLLAVTVLMPGCGKKTRPVPPDTVQPAPIRDLQYALDEKGVTLTWSFPTRTVKGERLPYTIEGFELFRAVIPKDDYCPGCPVTFGPPIDIKSDELLTGDKVSYSEALLRPAHRYVYKVRCVIGWYTTGNDSNEVSFLWDTPVDAPVNLRISSGDKYLKLSWQPPSTLLDTTSIVGPLAYQVYRSEDGSHFSRFGDPVSEPSFTDKSVRNDKKYFYKVRAVRMLEDTKAAGIASDVVTGVPRDETPPAPPQFIRVVKTEEGVKVFWDTVAEEDLAGFRVYRRLPQMRKPLLLGEVDATTLLFVDREPIGGESARYYSVTGFDWARPSNESLFSKEVELEIVR